MRKTLFLTLFILANAITSYGQSMHLIKAKILYDLENYKDLYDVAYKALIAEPKSDMANFYVGISYCYLGDTANAQYFLNEAIMLSTEVNKLDMVDVRAAYLYDIGKYTASLDDLYFLVSNDRKQYGVYYYMALCYDNLQQSDSAGVYYRAALSLNANTEDVLSDYARFKMINGDLDSAGILFRKCLVNNQRSVPAMMGLARIDLIKENFNGLIDKTDGVIKEIKESYYDSTAILMAYIDVYHFRMLASVYFEKYETLKTDLKNFETTEPYTMGLKTLLSATALIDQNKLSEAKKELSKIHDSITFSYNEMNQIQLVLFMHDKDVKGLTNFIIQWQDKILPSEKSLKDRILEIPPVQKKTIAGDIIYFKNSENGDLTLGITIIPDKEFLLKVLDNLSKLNKTKKSTSASIKAEVALKELLEAI